MYTCTYPYHLKHVYKYRYSRNFLLLHKHKFGCTAEKKTKISRKVSEKKTYEIKTRISHLFPVANQTKKILKRAPRSMCQMSWTCLRIRSTEIRRAN